MSKSKSYCPLLTGADFPAALVEPLVTRLVPPVLADFALEPLLRAVLGSHSLSLLKKQRVLEGIPTFSIFQHDELMKVFTSETEEFTKLLAEDAPIILNLSACAWIEANVLAGYYAVGYATREQEEQDLTTLLARKYNTPKRRAWIEAIPLNQWQPAAQAIFGRLLPKPVSKAATDSMLVI